MKVNPYHLKKAELQLYLTGYCKHRMPYQQHPTCFQKEILDKGRDLKIGILDLEFQNFKANYGILLTYFIKYYHQDKYCSGKITQKEVRGKFLDKKLVEKLTKDLENFDILITYYGTKCDMPYMRTRALRWKITFPQYGTIKHIDMYYLVKSKLSLNRNSLENVCFLLGIKGKNHVFGETWIKAVTGNEKCINYIYKHNKKDVDILEKLYDRLIQFNRKLNRSI